jgi:hypothetical protein
MNWARQNLDRLLLSTGGITVLIVGIAVRDRQGIAIVLAFVGCGLFFAGVALRRLQSIRVGTKGFEARLDKVEHKVDSLPTRIALADLVAEGDQVVNALSMAKQMFEADLEHRREPNFDLSVWDRELVWLRDARNFIAGAPELGEADATLFDTQVPMAPRKFRLPERFDDSIDLARAKQDRLRELIRRLE